MKITLKIFIKNKLNNLLCKISPSYRMISIINNKLIFVEKAINDTKSELSKVRCDNRSEKNSIDELISVQKSEASVLNDRINGLVESINNMKKMEGRKFIHDSVNSKKILISIVCLIYKSTTFAKSVRDSLYKYTPKLSTGEAELLFVANDASKDVINYLKYENYNFAINNNKFLTEDQLFKLGYGVPEYMNRVYCGYNFGIRKSKGEIVVLINSDNMFSPNWLENLLKNLNKKNIVCSQIVERKHPKFGIFPKAILGEFGSHPDNYNEKKFLSFVKRNSRDKLILGGAYMPCMVHKRNIEKVGYYPEGNIAGKQFDEIVRYGDERFYDKLDVSGVTHYTACNSIVYHFKEGEKED